MVRSIRECLTPLQKFREMIEPFATSNRLPDLSSIPKTFKIAYVMMAELLHV
jgi:hypothetical protein